MNDSITCNCQGNKGQETILNLVNEYKEIPGSLITILSKAQHIYGYLPKETLYTVSSGLNIPISEIMGVVTFYSFFSTTPKGKYNIMVCIGTACYVKGAEDVLDTFKKELDLEVGKTTTDKMFSLCSARCFGACGLAPAININGNVHRQVTPEKVTDIISYYRNKEGKMPNENN
ncbi:MAG: NAD(P)H-dependent oxidoreductase subunit E [bacterium]